MATSKSDRKKSVKSVKNLIIILMVLIIFIGIPYFFQPYILYTNGDAFDYFPPPYDRMGRVTLWTNNGALVAVKKIIK